MYIYFGVIGTKSYYSRLIITVLKKLRKKSKYMLYTNLKKTFHNWKKWFDRLTQAVGMAVYNRKINSHKP